MPWECNAMRNVPVRERVAEVISEVLASWPSIGLLLFAFVVPRLGALIGPVFILGGGLGALIKAGGPEIGHDGRDYGLERRRSAVFASLGAVLLLLSLSRLFPGAGL